MLYTCFFLLSFKEKSFLKNYFVYLFLDVLGLSCYEGFLFSIALSRAYSVVAEQRLLTAMSSLVVEHGF